MSLLAPIVPAVLSVRRLPRADLALLRAYGADPAVHTALGLVTCDQDDALYVAQAMPWINPLHEAEASAALIAAKLSSPQEQIRRRGANPNHVVEQLRAWQTLTSDLPAPDGAMPAKPMA